jgi:hypothetical protein
MTDFPPDLITQKCRSADCEDLAEYWAEVAPRWNRQRDSKRRSKRVRSMGDPWSGWWCHVHLLRVLDLKLLEVPNTKVLLIRRAPWAYVNTKWERPCGL